MSKSSPSGFTLLELMTVVVIIGILSAVASARYANLYRKAEEGGLQGNLGAIRSALSVYYADTDGVYPLSLAILTASSKYLKEIPAAKVPSYHAASATVTPAASAGDAGGWLYDDSASSPRFGAAAVNCVHTDSKGGVWSAY